MYFIASHTVKCSFALIISYAGFIASLHIKETGTDLSLLVSLFSVKTRGVTSNLP